MVASSLNLVFSSVRARSCNIDVRNIGDLESSECDLTGERSQSARCAVINLDHIHRTGKYACTPQIAHRNLLRVHRSTVGDDPVVDPVVAPGART